jgi:hypothetical protein
MKIAFLGNFTVDFSSESHYLKTFRKLGHEVITFQENAYRFNQSDINRVLECDMFFWVHTHNWDNQGLKALLKAIKGRVPIVGYHLDLWIGIQRERDLNSDEYWKWMDYFFCTDPEMVDLLNATPNRPKSFYLAAGVFEDECYMGNKRPEFDYDVVFTGSALNYHPEWPYREKLVGFLRETYGDRFGHYGSGGNPTVRGKDLNDLYASAKIVVGDTLCPNFTKPGYFSDRLFETTGRGAFVIFPYIRGIENYFELATSENQEIVTYTFDNFDSLESQIEFYLENEDNRKAIQSRGHLRTKREHTYTQRLQVIINTINDERAKN